MSHVVLFDGECGLCDKFVQLILKRDKLDKFRFAALQSERGRAIIHAQGHDPADLSTVLVLRQDGRLLERGRAALFVAKELGWPWRAFLGFAILPTAVLDWAYNRVASHRYRWFGRRDSCMMPTPETRRKFLE